MYIDVKKDSLDQENGFSFDIGGTCAKIAYIDQTQLKNKDYIRIHFKTFLRDELDEIVKYLESKCPTNDAKDIVVKASGFGAVKHKSALERRLNVKIQIASEFDGFVKSTRHFLNHYSVRESFTPMYDGVLEKVQATLDAFSETPFTDLGAEIGDDATPKRKLAQSLNLARHENIKEYFPCLMCMFGSGIAIYLIDADGKFTMLDGTCYGGRWLMALVKLILGITTFEDFVALAKKGDITKVDLCGSHQKTPTGDQEDVKMYTAYPDNETMFTLGQIAECKDDLDKFKKEDIAASLLQAYLFTQAQMIESCARAMQINRLLFAGGFLSDDFTAKQLEYNIALRLQLAPNPDMEYGFVKNGGHYGALGLLLK